MSNSTVSLGSNIFGFIAGGFSLLALLLSVCRSHLPSRKIKDLESLLDETEKVFNSAVEEGVLTETEFVHKIQCRLVELKHHTAGLRARAHSATTLWQDYAELFRGTSMAIGFGCRSLKILKSQVIVSSQDGRRKLLADNAPNAADIHVSEVSSILSSDVPLGSNVLLRTEVVRPNSCPPAIPIRENVQRNNPIEPTRRKVPQGAEA